MSRRGWGKAIAAASSLSLAAAIFSRSLSGHHSWNESTSFLVMCDDDEPNCPNCTYSTTIYYDSWALVGDDVEVTVQHDVEDPRCTTQFALRSASLNIEPADPVSIVGSRRMTWVLSSDRPGKKLFTAYRDANALYTTAIRFRNRHDIDLWIAFSAILAVLAFLMTWSPLEPVWVRLLSHLGVKPK